MSLYEELRAEPVSYPMEVCEMHVAAEHDETCCMNGVPPGKGPHPDCPGASKVEGT